MSITTPVYNQLLSLLNEHSQYRDLRHLKALAWMINALLCSETIKRLAAQLLSNYPPKKQITSSRIEEQD